MTRPIITSTANQSVKFAKRVREGKERELIFVEGSRLVAEALSSQIEVAEAFITPAFADANVELLDRFTALGLSLTFVADNVLKAIAETPSPQGIAVIARRPEHSLADISKRFDEKGNGGVAIYLYQIGNPANLGAIVRTAEAAGAVGVITSERSTDAFSPASLRGSMGSAFRLPMVEDISINDAANFAKNNRAKLVSVDVKGDRDYTEVGWNERRLLVFGSEAHGLPDEMLAASDEIITIPMASPVESLNLAVSAGIILFEARRQTT